ncbi:hypothetical protein SAMN05421780_102318 [Flexibacter flexilis DSM 6793]|uniref:Nucleoporin POM152 Ig-like domain-containing protein n=1 Tax=Flexibacter flexilis DSM 6793 TaxID=927664 RepID=A0A1I1FTS6_9BACT|nr:hypothetical protein [Flexibacter flexilis]SFC02701.1 hypothetical protein SAMN05421780_102318 [Flexibacter flexilis DSM 6793]
MKQLLQLLQLLQRTRWLAVVLLLWGMASQQASAQVAYNLEVRDTVRADTLYLTYKVTNTGAAFTFGNSNFPVNFNSAFVSAVDFANPKIHKRGKWDFANSAANYNLLTATTSQFAGQNRLIVNINQKTGGGTTGGVLLAAGATEVIAVIKFKITNCSASPTMQWLTTGAITDFNNNNIKTGATRIYPAITPTATTISLAPTLVESISGATSVCAGNIFHYRIKKEAGYTYSWFTTIVSSPLPTFSAHADSLGYDTVSVTIPAGATSGDIKVEATSGSCKDTAALAVTVNPSSSASFLTSDTTMCSGASRVMKVSLSGGTGTWNLVYNDGTSDINVTGITSSPYTFTISPTSTTIYTLKSVSSGGCASTVSGSATVTVNPLPVVSATPTSATVCSGSAPSIVLNSTGTTPTYSWTAALQSGSVTGFSLTGTSSTIAEALTGSGVVRYTITSSAGGCTSSAITVDVTVNPLPTATLSGSGSICSGGTTSLSVVLTGTGPWNLLYNDGTSNVTVNNILSSPHSISVSPTSTTTYTLVSVSDANCTGTVSGSATVTVNPLPVVSATPTSATVCSGSAPSIVLNSTGTTPTYSWTAALQSGSVTGFSLTGTSSTIAEALTGSGVVRYTITSSAGGCTSSAITVDVTVNPLPTATLSGSGSICSGGTTSLSVVLTGTGPWNLLYNDGTGNVTVNNILSSPHSISVSPTSTTTYTLVSVSDANCTGTVSGSAIVIVTPAPTLTAPPASVCQASTITLTASSSVDWSVTTTGDVQATFVSGTSAVSLLTGTSTATLQFGISTLGNATVTVTSGGCSNSYTIGVDAGAGLSLNLFLQGFYSGASIMTTDLSAGVPSILSDQYLATGTLPSAGEGVPTSLMRAGASVPAGAVDVIQIELRSGGATGPVAYTTYAWLMSDGSITDYKTGVGTNAIFPCSLLPNDYFIVVKHRNHLAIMSSTPVAFSAGSTASYNFTTSIGQVYGSGALDLDVGVVGMIAGDNRKDANNESNGDDFYDVSVATTNGTGFTGSGYFATDLNGTGVSNASDYNLSSTNNDNLYFSTVP